jgi:hydroxymethylpyrimidine/phosphomethylpyrimidine kinase
MLTQQEISTVDEMKSAAERIVGQGAKAVLIKGGALSGEAKGVDVWFDGEAFEILRAKPVQTKNNHGTGCTLSAAIAAQVALGKDLKTAVKVAKQYLTSALESALDLGAGSGPVGHFFSLQRHD